MRRTERRVLVLGSIVFLLTLTAVGGAAAPAVLDGAPSPPSPVPGSLAAFAERAVGGRTEASFRNAIELMVLVAACGIAVALYSASGGGQSGKRVPMRIRRR
jgi:hypothetical protein